MLRAKPFAAGKKAVKNKSIAAVTYLYLMLPFIIFSLGWIGKRYSVFFIPLLCICFYKACKDSEAVWLPELTGENILKILVILFSIFTWVYYSGIGRMTFQNSDHNCRNAIFEILVQYDWPVYNYNVIPENFAEGTTATSLVYYIGFWLPSAVVGKAFGIEAGYKFQVFWAVLGISLVYYYICSRKKKLLLWPLAVLIFFSGLDIVGEYLRGVDLLTMSNDMHLERWMEPYQYSSMTTQLYWVFNQAIPAWLCTIFCYVQKNNRSIVLVLSCCMLTSTLPFIGLLILVIFWVLSRHYEIQPDLRPVDKVKEKVMRLLKDTCTFQNIVGGGIIGIISFLYLKTNLSGTRIMQESQNGAVYDNHLAKYLIFIIIEVGVYFLAVYKYHKSNSLFYVILTSLLIIPPLKVGSGTDFCMRASIPALFILMLFVMETLEKAGECRDKVTLWVLLLLLGIGSITPIHELKRSIAVTADRINNEEQIYERSVDYNELLNAPNFSGSTDNSFFYKYIAK